MKKLTIILAIVFSMKVSYADTKYFAETDKNNVVKRVIVADSVEWCNKNLGGKWIETHMDKIGCNYAGKGDDYLEIYNDFCRPQPFPSWVLNEKRRWESPKSQPVDGKQYRWNEDIIDWEELR